MFSGPDIKLWNIVKKTDPLVGTCPVSLTSLGVILTKAFSSKALNELKAWLANIFLSAKNSIRGALFPSLCLFHLDWNNFQAIWNAITVLPVPVARVRSILCCLSAIASKVLLIAISW